MEDLGLRATSLGGLLLMIGVAWLLSENRRQLPWRVIAWGLGLQLAFGWVVLKTSLGLSLFGALNDAVVKLLSFTEEGSRFLFGNYLDREFSLALNVLPTIIFFSSLMTVLYHLRLMQPVVRGLAWAMQRTMGLSGSETLSAASNIFVGQTEAPLVIKPFIATMTRSELHAVMVGGFATVAGGVMAAYVGMLKQHLPDIAGHLIAASVMSAPAALVIAKVMLPEADPSAISGELRMDEERRDVNVIDAATRGAREGLSLALNVAAMLLAFLGLVALLNYLLSLPAVWHNHLTPGDPWTPLTMERAGAYLMWPFALMMGVTPGEALAVAELLGEKIVLNEFVAYLHLAERSASPQALSERSMVIASYALCGFANFGSIAIQIGGIGAIAPERRSDLARLGMRAMLGGTLAAFMTACVAGMMV